jgi:hypothetical protein
MELFNLATDLGLIDKGGAWYTFTTVKDTPKFQGQEKGRDYLAQNPEVYDSLWATVKETMGIP